MSMSREDFRMNASVPNARKTGILPARKVVPLIALAAFQ